MTQNMTLAKRCAIIAAAVFMSGTMAFAQPGPAGGGGGGGGGPGAGGPGGGGPGGQMGGGRGMQMMAQPGQALGAFLNVLGDLNLHPDFSLSADQKTKIDAIRGSFKDAEKAWHEKNADAIKKIDDDMADLRQQGQNMDRDALREVMNQRRELYATAPTGQEQVDQIKPVLTEEQTKRIDARVEEMRKEREQNGPPGGGGGRGGNGGGGGGGGGPGGPGGPPMIN